MTVFREGIPKCIQEEANARPKSLTRCSIQLGSGAMRIRGPRWTIQEHLWLSRCVQQEDSGPPSFLIPLQKLKKSPVSSDSQRAHRRRGDFAETITAGRGHQWYPPQPQRHGSGSCLVKIYISPLLTHKEQETHLTAAVGAPN